MGSQAVVVAAGGSSFGVFQSPDSALMVMSAGHPDRMRQVWCDELTPADREPLE